MQFVNSKEYIIYKENNWSSQVLKDGLRQLTAEDIMVVSKVQIFRDINQSNLEILSRVNTL